MGSLSTYTIFKRMAVQNPDMHLLSPEEVRAVQQVLLSMMDDIHAFCEAYHLTYAMCGGGAIGAVRHGGFIPWDDDIDLCMPRQDYDRFRDLFLREQSGKYYVQEIRISKGYDLNFMKVRLKNSTFCEPLDPEPEKAGVFIDILPVENVYANRVLRGIQWLLSDGLQFITSCVRIRKKRRRLLEMAGEYQEAVRAIRLKSLIALPFCILPFRAWLLLAEKALMMNHDHASALVSIPTGGKHFRGEIFRRETLFPAKLVPFAGRKYYSMGALDVYLTQRYGDYMTLPPEEEREQHALLSFALPDEDAKS